MPQQPSSRKRRTYDVLVTREVLGIRQKPKKRRRTYPRVRLLSVPLLIVLTAAAVHLLKSPTYTVHSAAVRGNTLVPAEAIYQASRIDGQNLFLLNAQATADAVERLPYVRHARVYVRPPAQVAIVVQEYEPRWVWTAGNSRYLIDETGNILPGNILPDNGMLEGTLTVVDPSGQALPIGSSLEPNLVEMLKALDQVLPDLKQIAYDERLGFIIDVGPGWPARIGDSPDQLAARIGVLNSLLPELVHMTQVQNQGVDFIDLRFAERPYYRLK
ncbi:MAG: Cell division protein DivIB [Anaerolineales bacterium]|nr:Cell division protein DivIB [Anaerolineales bacterium]